MKYKILITFLSSISIINCDLVCKEDGLFENSDDRTSYYECTDGKSYLRRCPKAEDGLSYLVFNGKECVEPFPAFVCPQESGKYRYTQNDGQFYECVENKPTLKNCPENTRFNGLECAEQEIKSNLVEPEDELEFTCPSPTGVYSNPDNRHSYYECEDDVPTLKLCPKQGKRTRRHKHPGQVGIHYKHRRRLIWDGHQCVQAHRFSDNRSARQAPAQTIPDTMFTCPVPEGRFPVPRDSHSYFHCQNSQPRLEVCPGDTIFSESQRGCVHTPNEIIIDNVPVTYPLRRQVEGPPQRGDITCPSGTIYDLASGRCRREELADPIAVSGPVVIEEGRAECPDDTVYDARTGQCRREILVEPIRTPVAVQTQVTNTCPTGFTYDQARRQCIRETLVDPIINNEQQISTRCPAGYFYDTARGQCVRETEVDPIINRPCQSGYEYDTGLRRCEPLGRYRRNGRVETEDHINGAVIVDTWNERQWRWDRNPNGQRILPDVNGWLERHFAYAHDKRTGEYAQGRPTHYDRGQQPRIEK